MSELLPYAGRDPMEGRPGYYPSFKPSKRQRAYRMFRSGRDTFDIAQVLGTTEARVLKWITLERSELLRLPAPYGERA